MSVCVKRTTASLQLYNEVVLSALGIERRWGVGGEERLTRELICILVAHRVQMAARHFCGSRWEPQCDPRRHTTSLGAMWLPREVEVSHWQKQQKTPRR